MSGRVRNTQRQNQLANQIVKIYLADGGRRKKKKKTRRKTKPKKEDEKQPIQAAQIAQLFPRFVGGAPSQVSSGVTSQQINEKLKAIEDRLQAVTTARTLAPPPAAAESKAEETPVEATAADVSAVDIIAHASPINALYDPAKPLDVPTGAIPPKFKHFLVNTKGDEIEIRFTPSYRAPRLIDELMKLGVFNSNDRKRMERMPLGDLQRMFIPLYNDHLHAMTQIQATMSAALASSS